MQTVPILVIEDNPAVQKSIFEALTPYDYEIIQATEGGEGLQLALNSNCKMLLLDLELPDTNGIEVLKVIRKQCFDLPVIIITGNSEEESCVNGLNCGADDYIVKPFNANELLARVRAVLRRSPERCERVKCLDIPDGKVIFEEFEVRFNDSSSERISGRELDLLSYFASNAGRIISREELFLRVWGKSAVNRQTRTIDMHVVRLREKLRDKASSLIETVHGKGYKYTGMGNNRD